MEDSFKPIWTCPWTGKCNFTFAPDFSGLDPETGEPWSPKKIVQLMGLKNLSSDFVKIACEKVIANNPDKVILYKSGKVNLIGYFIKLVLEETNKQADPKIAVEILKELMK
jgi:Asp-tRNA(Asn)/Glu-tRNA(Gln) amidotransferase B subunit